MARAEAPVQKIGLLMTRPEGSNGPFVAQIAGDILARLTVVETPLIAITPLGTDPMLNPKDAAIFSSSNGVRYAPAGQGRRAFCVGKRTTETASSAGWNAICAGQTADALVQYLIANKPQMRLRHLSGVHQRGDIVTRLTAAGLNAAQTQIYDQPLLPLSKTAQNLLSQNGPVIVPLFSPRAAAQFAACSPRQSGLTVICLSAAVLHELNLSGENQTFIPAAPEARLMLEMVEIQARAISLG